MMNSIRHVACAALFLSSFFAKAQQDRLRGVNVGDIAPEIEMKNPDGEVLKLSQLKGKIVLVDFWASWCRPCRMENPHVRHMYHAYKDKPYAKASGFQVFSVSLDRAGAGDQWKKAISTDSLDWKWHVGAVEDGVNPASQQYQVYFIPTNVLIDADGKVLGKDLHGDALEQLLDTLIETDPAKLDAWKKQQAADQKAAEKAAKNNKKKP